MTGDVLLRDCAHLYADLGEGPRLLTGHDLLVEEGRITSIGTSLTAPEGVRTVDASRWLVVPGLVNTHHHLSQQLTRTQACSSGLIDWLTRLYPVWKHMDADLAYAAARVGIAELLLSGCTTVGDFTYFFPRGRPEIFDAQVEAARSLGCRFAPVRGGLVEVEAGVRRQLGGDLDASLEDPDEMLAEMSRALAVHHDPSEQSLCRVSLGLTEKAYAAPTLMREIASMARGAATGLHTHLHPRPDERERARQAVGGDPVSFLTEVDWWNDRLWVGHGTGLLPEEVASAASVGVGLALSPSSNARFGLPIAPGLAAHQAGARVSIGVDGAASNDAGNLVAEARLVLQTQRIRAAADGLPFGDVTAERVLRWATEDGAATLGWSRLGRLAEGWAGDVAAFDLSGLEDVGAANALDALLLCGTGGRRAALTVVDGEVVVDEGGLALADLAEIASAGRRAGRTLWSRADVSEIEVTA